MPAFGKGKLWDLVFDPGNLAGAADRLGRYRQEHPDEIVTMAGELRDMFFTEATEERFIRLFDL